eukprot:TRINITY_DN6909_c0_g1_i4.p1 TRINITY_DN6909_c0_g1~~TRINITY_DN6909_c0_g1_i4.p1  ORF type:complete len:204 (-),score=49.23 TRINITY_DN6909_c0_g1_i4:122-733(-)
MKVKGNAKWYKSGWWLKCISWLLEFLVQRVKLNHLLFHLFDPKASSGINAEYGGSGGGGGGGGGGSGGGGGGGLKEMNVYIKFLSSFIPTSRKFKTTIVKRMDIPHWVFVEPIPLLVQEKEYLMANHITFVVMSNTPKGHKNIPLGQAVVSLATACNEVYSNFVSPVFHKGRECGFVSGDLQCTGTISVKNKLHFLRSKWNGL